MFSAPVSVVHTVSKSIRMRSSVDTAKGRGGNLWSNLPEICEILHIPVERSMINEDCHFQHVQYKAGQRIYTIDQAFEMLYIVTAGFLKTAMIDEDGNEQVLSFPMKGDLLGIDGIHLNQYASEAVALSDCTVILVPFRQLRTLGRAYPALDFAMYGTMSRELKREHAMVSMMGSLSVEARVARFLASLSDRFCEMGYSGRQFNLRMTRQEIGSYLGMTMETASRTMSAFDAIGIISVVQRTVEILDIQALRTLRRLPAASQGRGKKDAKRAAFAAA